MRIDYQTYGDSSDHPVVLIHPFPFTAEIWCEVAQDVSAAGYFVVTPNLRGCGATELSQEKPDIDLLAEDILDLIAELGLSNPTIGGISLGGYVVMAALRIAADCTDSIILLDTKASADSAEAKANRLRIAEQMRTAGKVELFAEQMLTNMISEDTKTNRPQVADEVRTWMQSAKPETIAWLQEAMANRLESFSVLQEFAGRSLLIRGSQDLISTEQDFADMQKNLRQVTYVEISNTGHLPIVEDPAEVSKQICNWLAETLVR